VSGKTDRYGRREKRRGFFGFHRIKNEIDPDSKKPRRTSDFILLRNNFTKIQSVRFALASRRTVHIMSLVPLIIIF